MRLRDLTVVRTAVIGVLASVSLATVLVVPALASKHPAAPVKYISGHLNAPAGYILAVVGYNGKAVFSTKSSFRLRAPDTKVTLQLINSHGVYAGPVVFGGSSSRVITGIRAGTNVGTIVVIPSKGYARTAHALAAKKVDKTRWAHAKHGVPIGNGLNLGLVVFKGQGGGAGAGGDLARIGVPNEFNVAVPGTKILKSLAPAVRATPPLKKAAQAKIAVVCPPPPAPVPPGCTPPPGSTGGTGGTPPTGGTGPTGGGGTAPPCPTGGTGSTGGSGGSGPPCVPAPTSTLSPWMSQMFLSMSDTVNVDAAGVTQADLDTTLQTWGDLALNVPTGDLVELNCNGLSFCSAGGSGQAQMSGLPNTNPQQPQLSAFGYDQITPFPASSLDPATGFGEIVGPAVPTGMLGTDSNGQEFNLDPRASTADIGSGDVITEVVTANGVTTDIPTTIDFVFNTVPAISAYSDSAGGSGTVTYPDTSGMGTPNNPIKAAAGANGDVTVTFTVFRPQRPGVAGAGEPAFMDIGHLGYAVDFHAGPLGGSGLSLVNSTGSGYCSTASYSNPSSTLTLEGPVASGGLGPTTGTSWLVDSANDQPASPSNTFSFTIDLSQCLRDKGNATFPVGIPVMFDLSAASQTARDQAVQTFAVERTS